MERMTLAKALELAVAELRRSKSLATSTGTATYGAIEKGEAAALLEELKRTLYGGISYVK